MKKLGLLLLLAGTLGVIVWGVLRRNEPPKVNLALVKRQTLVSNLPTNGKAEPAEWQAIRAETGGVIARMFVEDGQTVAKGAIIATISDPTLQAEIEAAEAKAAEARANLAALEAGGRPSDFAEIDNSLARARFDLQKSQEDLAALERLQQKQAVTRQEVESARQKVQELQLQITALNKRRGSLVAAPDVTAAKARVADAETAIRLAKERGALSSVRAPIAGVVYGREVRQGSYVNAGDLIANVGRLDQLRVKVYVDEPELGRVEVGQPMTITWDALPGREWQGRVERKPTAIQALGSRQVGEVIGSITNTEHSLIAGTNVNAEIRTGTVESALVIPKETLRHDQQGDYVYLVRSGVVERRPVKKGISSLTQVQIAEGLNEGDAILLPTDIPVKPGDRVKPIV